MNKDVNEYLRMVCNDLVTQLIALNMIATEYERATGHKIPKPKLDKSKIDRIYWKG